jgi:hypothetical protein
MDSNLQYAGAVNLIVAPFVAPVAGDLAAGADERIVTDRDAGQNDRPCSDPDAAPDPNRTPKFEIRGRQPARPPSATRHACGLRRQTGSTC